MVLVDRIFLGNMVVHLCMGQSILVAKSCGVACKKLVSCGSCCGRIGP